MNSQNLRLFLLFYVVYEQAAGSRNIIKRLNAIENRLDYIDGRLNSESKSTREDFDTVFEKLELIQSSLNLHSVPADRDVTEINEQLELTGASSITMQHLPEQYVESTLQSLVRGLESEKLENLRIRRDFPAMKEKITVLAESIQNQEKHYHKILQYLDLIVNSTTEVKVHVLATKQSVNEIQEAQLKAKETTIHHLAVLQNKTVELYSSGTAQILTLLENNTWICDAPIKEDIVENKVSTKLQLSTETTERQDIKECEKCSSCRDLQNTGQKQNGVYQIHLNSNRVSVFCDMTTDGGGWTVFQRRQDGSVDFYRDWEDYKSGFGDLSGEFWLGNEYLHLMTSTGESKILRVDLKDYLGNEAYAEYTNFLIRSENDKYNIHLGTYSGNASDSMLRHQGMMFSTKDRDNDDYFGHCAELRHGGWWYADCTDSNLNGIYETSSSCTLEKFACIHWYFFKYDHRPFIFTEMKFR